MTESQDLFCMRSTTETTPFELFIICVEILALIYIKQNHVRKNHR